MHIFESFGKFATKNPTLVVKTLDEIEFTRIAEKYATLKIEVVALSKEKFFYVS